MCGKEFDVWLIAQIHFHLHEVQIFLKQLTLTILITVELC